MGGCRRVGRVEGGRRVEGGGEGMWEWKGCWGREGMGGEGVYEGGEGVWWRGEGIWWRWKGRHVPGRLDNTYNLPLLKLYIKPNSDLSPLVLHVIC